MKLVDIMGIGKKYDIVGYIKHDVLNLKFRIVDGVMFTKNDKTGIFRTCLMTCNWFDIDRFEITEILPKGDKERLRYKDVLDILNALKPNAYCWRNGTLKIK